MKLLLFLSLLTPGFFPADHNQTFVNPTGTYTLKGEVRDNKVVSHSGEIRVKLLHPQLVTLCFFIDKGYPGYESGAFLDTLRYDDNAAVYMSRDSNCILRFFFKSNGVELIHIFTQNASDCGFAPGVLTGAFFRKTSSGIPVIQDLSSLRTTIHD